MSERKLTNPKTRKPKKQKLYTQLLNEVAEETGFSKSDIKIVIRCFIKKVKEAILSKQKVSIPTIGMIYPTIRRGKDVSNSPWAEVAQQIWAGSRWLIKIKANEKMEAELKEMSVSPLEERKMFYGY